ncbi:hypothetical protein SAMN05444411_1313 [Lutibacter oricola]|uniref:Uncharacterized protein n=1 Tax=Lutibacter oricola TaxID=762486 RepID=A0A1H3HA32_9FLAO|nr:hypothetical protein [Lutibacter oricola]SDY12453.1 hypothetical protein SAMN05444411_1313 [Lutibacter oricola]
MKKDITEKFISDIQTIITSDIFSKRLKINLSNFPNQKLESHIRNLIVEIYNEENSEKRAFGEHPRYKNIKTKARATIDFSICTEKVVNFTMELKYNYPRDSSYFSNYLTNILQKDFIEREYDEGKKVNAFLQIICKTDRENFEEFENKWGLNTLSKYQLNNSKITWEENLLNGFKDVKTHLKEKQNVECDYKVLHKQEIQTNDLKTDFTFYIIYRK